MVTPEELISPDARFITDRKGAAIMLGGMRIKLSPDELTSLLMSAVTTLGVPVPDETLINLAG